MNNDEAKFILQAYRSGGQDAGDAQFDEALKQVQRDRELAVWFAHEQTLDAAISAKIRENPVPSELRATVLAGRNVLRPTQWWRRRSLLALAASVVVLLALAPFWFQPRRNGLAAFRNEMARMLGSHSYQLAITSEDVAQIQTWLTEHNGHANLALTGGLKDLRGYGCQVLSWQGKKVTMICLRVQGPGIVHLLVIDSADLSDPPAPGTFRFAPAGEFMTASWSRGQKTYVLAGHGDRAALERIL